MNVTNHENSVIIVNLDATMIVSLTGGKSIILSSSTTCSYSRLSLKSTESAELNCCNSITIQSVSAKNEYLDLNQQMELATKEAAKQLEAEQQKSKSSKAQLAKCLLDVIITAAKDKYQIPEDLELNKDAIRKRVKLGSKGGKRGLNSPMLEVGADMRTPITTSQGLQLANSLKKGASIEEKVIEWKKKCCKSF
jgi:hypothetical protein